MLPLQILIGYVIFTIVGVILIPRNNHLGIRLFSLGNSITVFGMAIILWNAFNKLKEGYHFECLIPVVPEYDINLTLGLDGISLCFVLLTTYIMPLCIFASKSITKNYKQFIIYLLLIELFLILTFLTTNLFFFYVFFEGVLIPMFLIIGVWGSRERKINAAYYFFLYTLFGSFFLLFGILYLYRLTGTLDYSELTYKILTAEQQKFLFVFFFIPFAIKVPMFPFHIWLPEAHVEAPTIGSVILASLLLKLGGYGFLRFTIPWFPAGCMHYSYVVYVLAVISIIYASLSTIRQSDLKRIIAYSSVAHMNIVVLGLFSFTHQGIDGAIYLMISHGLVSSALFFCIGVLYDRYHTRSVRHFSGLVMLMPLFCTFFFIFTCANMSFPGTSNFAGELLVFSGLFIKNNYLVVLSSISIVLSAIYSIWVYNRVSYGTLKIESENVANYSDLNREEFCILFLLAVGMLILGIHTGFVTSLTNVPINTILEVIGPKLD